MKRCKLDKIASVTLRLQLDHNAILGAEIPAEAGTVVAARVLNAKPQYNTLEDVHGLKKNVSIVTPLRDPNLPTVEALRRALLKK